MFFRVSLSIIKEKLERFGTMNNEKTGALIAQIRKENGLHRSSLLIKSVFQMRQFQNGRQLRDFRIYLCSNLWQKLFIFQFLKYLLVKDWKVQRTLMICSQNSSIYLLQNRPERPGFIIGLLLLQLRYYISL